MSQGFDPYYKWLGISPAEQPPNHYRLLGINLFETDPDVIQAAADQRMAHLKGLRLGKHVELSERLLNEVAGARACLLSARSKETYDLELATEIELSRPPVDIADIPASVAASPASPKTAHSPAPHHVLPKRGLPERTKTPSHNWLRDIIVVTLLIAACIAAYEYCRWQPPGKLSIVLENAPRGTVVLVDGEPVENLARAVVLTPGEHEVIIRSFDQTVLRRQTVLVKPDESKTVYVPLTVR